MRALLTMLVVLGMAGDARADRVLKGAEPVTRLSPTCFAYPKYVVILLRPADAGMVEGEAIVVRKKDAEEVEDVARSCSPLDSSVIFRTVPHGNSQFAGLLGDVVMIWDEDVRSSLFGYELPSGNELFVARNPTQVTVEKESQSLSFSIPMQSHDCETSLRATNLPVATCRSRLNEALACIKGSSERYAKIEAKRSFAEKAKQKDCSFDVRERVKFNLQTKRIEPTYEVFAEGSTAIAD